MASSLPPSEVVVQNGVQLPLTEGPKIFLSPSSFMWVCSQILIGLGITVENLLSILQNLYILSTKKKNNLRVQVDDIYKQVDYILKAVSVTIPS